MSPKPEHVANASAEPAPDAPQDGGAIAVELDPVRAVVPQSCSCCLEPAAYTRRTRGAGGELLVPYCDACLDHASGHTTRTLSVAVASALAGLVCAAALPLVRPYLALAPYLATSAGVTLIPALVALVTRRRPAQQHSASGVAVWWKKDAWLCANPKWGKLLADSNASTWRRCAARGPRLSPWMLTGAIVTLVGAPFWYLHLHPPVRILNLGDVELTVFSDGQRVAKVLPSTTESPAAGRLVRLPAGPRRLSATAGPKRVLVHSQTVKLLPSTEHLYLPTKAGHCFWLEITEYGRARVNGPTLQPVMVERSFLALSNRVDSWFAPNPPAATDLRSTGGILTALRQAPCRLAPGEPTPDSPGNASGD